eukprot:107380-Hanusia_phi.AAC.1
MERTTRFIAQILGSKRLKRKKLSTHGLREQTYAVAWYDPSDRRTGKLQVSRSPPAPPASEAH